MLAILPSSAASIVGAVWASIGETGRPTSSRNCASAAARPQPARSHGRQFSAQHGGPAHVGDRRVERPRQRLRHDPEQRALAQVAEQQPGQELLLGLGGASE
jgi:hypothetical protein